MTSDFVRIVVAAVAIASLGFVTAAPAFAQAPGPAPAPVSLKPPVSVSTPAPPQASGPASAAEADYTIGIDDILHVIVWDNKELEQDVVVRPDGKISYPLAGEIYVQGDARAVQFIPDAKPVAGELQPFAKRTAKAGWQRHSRLGRTGDRSCATVGRGRLFLHEERDRR